MIKIASKKDAEQLFGVGLYTPTEAAEYARVSTQLMTRWIYGSAGGESVVKPQIPDTQDKTVTFLDLIQALAIRRIRNEHPKISLQKIRQAYDTATNHFNVKYPFALKQTRIGIFGSPHEPANQQIWIAVDGDLDDFKSKVYQLTGPNRKNQLLNEVVRTYTTHIVFDDTTDLARRYYPFSFGLSKTQNQDRIVIDPEVRFGEPFVESCGYTAQTLYAAYISEGGIDQAAKNCGVSVAAITIAVEYIDFLDKKTKA